MQRETFGTIDLRIRLYGAVVGWFNSPSQPAHLTITRLELQKAGGYCAVHVGFFLHN